MSLAASIPEQGFLHGWWIAYIEVCIFLFGWGVILKRRILIKMKRMEEKGVQGLPISGSKPPDSQASRQLSSYLREGKFRETEDASFIRLCVWDRVLTYVGSFLVFIPLICLLLRYVVLPNLGCFSK